MSELTLQYSITLTLSPQEFTLIGRALSGVLPPGENRRAAELSARLTSQMERRCRERFDVAEAATRRANELLQQIPETEPTDQE